MPTAQVTITSELQVMTCWHCGAIFAVNNHWAESRMREHSRQPIYCPHGHENLYQRSDLNEQETAIIDLAAEREKSAELRRRLTRALHALDQHNLPDPDAPGEAHADDAPSPGQSWIAACDTGDSAKPFKCPKCGRTFYKAQSARMHLRRGHGVDPDAAIDSQRA